MTGMTQDSVDEVDETDLALIHALQVTPRASWTQLGRALRVDPATVARRWQRLERAGLAWVTCVVGPALHTEFCMAYVEVECAPGRLAEVAAELSGRPEIGYVHHLTGHYGLLAVLALRTPAEVSAHLAQFLGPMPAVRSYRAQIRTIGFSESSRWRLRSLEPAQQGALEAGPPAADPGQPWADRRQTRTDGSDQQLYRLLHEDGRMPFTELARRTGVSEPTARRRVARLLGNRLLRLRCEVAQSVTGWPITAVLWGEVPAERLDSAGRALTALADVRLCCAMTGPRNLLLMVWLRSLEDLPRLEASIARRCGVNVVDRSVCLQTFKQMGRLLDTQGRSVGNVEPNSVGFESPTTALPGPADAAPRYASR